jgi:hypothetical protein
VSLPVPAHLSEDGRRAFDAIVGVLRKARVREADYGGNRPFYSPVEWAARREKFGLESVLIVTYDGGAHGRFFGLDRDLATSPRGKSYANVERMQAALAEAGFHVEECTGWYAAVYKTASQPAVEECA